MSVIIHASAQSSQGAQKRQVQALVQHLPMERHIAAADRTARHVALTELAAANAKSTSTAVTISALPRLRALCRTSLLAFGMNISTSSAPAHLQIGSLWSAMLY